jgi:hypothetical protein
MRSAAYLTKAHEHDRDAKDYRELATYMEARERGEAVDWLPMTPRRFRGPVSAHSAEDYRRKAAVAAEKADTARTLAAMLHAIEVHQAGPQRVEIEQHFQLSILHGLLDRALKAARDILTVATDEEQPGYAAVPHVMRLIEEGMRMLDVDGGADDGEKSTNR